MGKPDRHKGAERVRVRLVSCPGLGRTQVSLPISAIRRPHLNRSAVLQTALFPVAQAKALRYGDGLSPPDLFREDLPACDRGTGV